MNREKTFKSVYGIEAPKAVLGLYVEDLQQVKRLSKSKQYQGLLELLLRYSYAIFYDYKTVSIINNRLKYRQEAMKLLNNDDVEKAFNFIKRAVEPKETDLEKIKRLKGELKELDKGIEYSAIETEIEELNKSIGLGASSATCIAKDEIKRLKEELDTKSYKLAKGQNKEDKEVFIKVALVALSTGARLKELTETLELSSKKGVIYFINGDDTEEGVILELDIKTIRAYIKDIRSHYGERIAKGTDISTGIRKAVKRLSIKISQGIIEDVIKANKDPKTKKPKREDLEYCENTNHLNTLYNECLTSSSPLNHQ